MAVRGSARGKGAGEERRKCSKHGCGQAEKGKARRPTHKGWQHVAGALQTMLLSGGAVLAGCRPTSHLSSSTQAAALSHGASSQVDACQRAIAGAPGGCC